jgi:hypothetical protein
VSDATTQLVTGFQLVCDAADCGHVECTGPLRPSLIGRPCPRCGRDLLTREDYFAAVRCVGVLRLLAVLGIVRAPRGDERGVAVNPRATGTKIQVRSQKAGVA